MAIDAWIDYTMAPTPPPKPIEEINTLTFNILNSPNAKAEPQIHQPTVSNPTSKLQPKTSAPPQSKTKKMVKLTSVVVVVERSFFFSPTTTSNQNELF